MKGGDGAADEYHNYKYFRKCPWLYKPLIPLTAAWEAEAPM